MLNLRLGKKQAVIMENMNGVPLAAIYGPCRLLTLSKGPLRYTRSDHLTSDQVAEKLKALGESEAFINSFVGCEKYEVFKAK